MKRAHLASLPAGPKPEPVDLTDRLLEREAGAAPDRPKAAAEAAKGAKPKRRRKAAVARGKAETPATRAQPETPQRGVSTGSDSGRDAALPRLGQAEMPQPETPASRRGASAGEEGGIAAEVTVEAALRQAAAAAQALRRAARATQARFEVAQGYRLDALAHHIRQVAEFIAALPKE